MIDGHIHIEKGDYTLDWIQQFVDRAVEMELDEIRLLEHNYMFKEFEPMYDTVRSCSDFVNNWFNSKACKKSYEQYLDLIDKVRAKQYPVSIKFGLEVCYFKDYEELIKEQTKDKGFDFLLGSIHFVDNFAFDHTAQLWEVFDGLGHPDSIKLFGHRPSYDLTDYYERLAIALSDSNMYADQNSGTQRRCSDTSPLGMDKELIKALRRHNVRIITSSDAHCPEDVGYKIKELMKYGGNTNVDCYVIQAEA